MAKRIITTDVLEEDVKNDANLRPQTLDEYIGQEKAKSNLKIYIEAARRERGFPGPRVVLWPSRPWKNHPCRNHCQRNARKLKSDFWPRH